MLSHKYRYRRIAGWSSLRLYNLFEGYRPSFPCQYRTSSGAMGFSSCCQLRGSIIFSGEWLQESCTLHPCFDVFWNFWNMVLWYPLNLRRYIMIYYDIYIFLIFLAGFQQPVMCFQLLPRWNQTFQERYQSAGPKEGQGVHQPLLMDPMAFLFRDPNLWATQCHKPS